MYKKLIITCLLFILINFARANEVLIIRSSNSILHQSCKQKDTSINIYLCKGNQIILGSKTINVSGIYIDTLLGQSGCDSIIHYTIKAIDTSSSNMDSTVCKGNKIIFAGKTLSVSGIYTDTLKNVNSCDSIIRMSLNYSDTSSVTNTYSICKGNFVLVNNKKLYISGVYNDTLTNKDGCDSIIHTNVLVNYATTSLITLNICRGQILSYGKYSFSDSGAHYIHLKNIAGCDSLLNIHINIYTNDTVVHLINHTLIADDTGATYQWYRCDNNDPLIDSNRQSFTPRHSGLYKVVMISSNGCIDTSECFTIRYTDIQILTENYFSIFPNPVYDKCIIKTDKVNAKLHIRLVDIYGVNRLTDDIEGDSWVNMKAMPSGLYVLKVNEENLKEFVFKIIKL